MLRAALYARVSTDLQKDEETVQNQLTEIYAEIEKDGNLLVKECEYVDEGWSGAILERPSLDMLRQDAAEGKFDILYVYDRGRLARKFVYQEIVIEEIQNHGITFKSLHDINGDSTEEKLMGGVMGLFHEYERAKITERFRIGKLNKVRRGIVVGTEAPYGYRYIPVKGKGLNKVDGRIVIDKKEAEVVKMVFDWVGNEGISLKEVVRRLYEKGIPPRRQKRPNWTSGPITRLARNESYTGRYYWFKTESVIPKNPSPRTQKKYQHRHTLKTSKQKKPKEEWFELKIPRIIDDGLFERVQKQLDSNSLFSNRNKKNPYLFGGLIYCTCGYKRTGEGHDKHFYYRCTSRILTFPLPSNCEEKGVNVQVLDAVGWKKIVDLLTQPKLLEEQLNKYLKRKEIERLNNTPLEEINNKLKQLEEEERRYVQAWGIGNMTEKIYVESMESVNTRRNALKKDLAKNREENIEVYNNIDLASISDPFKEYLEKLSFEDKLFTVRKIVDKVIATKEKVKICGNIPIYDNLTEAHVGLHAEYRYCWSSKRW